jgi:hypothetical protein
MVFRALTGGITPAGSLRRQTLKSLVAAITPGGTAAKLARHTLSGAIHPTSSSVTKDAREAPTADLVSSESFGVTIVSLAWSGVTLTSKEERE